MGECMAWEQTALSMSYNIVPKATTRSALLTATESRRLHKNTQAAFAAVIIRLHGVSNLE